MIEILKDYLDSIENKNWQVQLGQISLLQPVLIIRTDGGNSMAFTMAPHNAGKLCVDDSLFGPCGRIPLHILDIPDLNDPDFDPEMVCMTVLEMITGDYHYESGQMLIFKKGLSVK